MDLLKQVKDWVTPSKIKADNLTSRLFYQVTFGICLTGFVILFGFTYFGQPIQCTCGNTCADCTVFESNCWKHGATRFLNNEEIKNAPCKYRKNDERKLTYYQWIVFILLLNAVVFRIPHTIWKILEGGIIKSFYSEDASSASILQDETAMNQILEQKSQLFGKIKDSLRWYHTKFLLSQFLNVVVVLVMFCLNNEFLQDRFLDYGLQPSDYDPMCDTFPTEVKSYL